MVFQDFLSTPGVQMFIALSLFMYYSLTRQTPPIHLLASFYPSGMEEAPPQAKTPRSYIQPLICLTFVKGETKHVYAHPLVNTPKETKEKD